ncbi:MAG: PecA family PE domain-processing aspartic protease [Mycobacterium sp.]|nr:PecA family PE domain-processing aspartic protease [Mycobacterium sp.]
MSKHRRIRPYAWLGAGAVTLGMGAAMVGGTAVALADSGADAASASDSVASSSAAPAQTAPTAAPRRSLAARASRSAAAPLAGDRRSRVAMPAGIAVIMTAPVSTPLPAAVTAATSVPAAVAGPVSSAPKPSAARRGVNRSTVGASAPKPAASPVVAVPTAAADPSYNMDSYLPLQTVVPGAHVQLAIAQIADAQALLNQETFGSGNIAAGVASIVPQLFLAEAAWSLSAWQNNMPAASQLVAGTVGIPIIHQLTQVNLLATMTLPTLAEAGLSGAALLLPLVNLLGASTAAAASVLTEARSNGKVYAVVPVQMKSVTEPVVNVSVNNGSRKSMLVDTGSSGLLLTRDSVGAGDLGAPIGTGEVTYSGAVTQTFHYTTYQTTVDLGGGAVSAPTAVNIVDEADAEAFKDFLAPAQVVGILGVGANTYGPGPGPSPGQGCTVPSAACTIPTASMPGELSDGFLLYQGAFLGLLGVMVLGPDPLATRVSVPGAPDANVQVSVNDGPKQDASSIIDTGGVYGTLPSYLIGGGTSVPSGTKISVYTADGQTLLYSYTTGLYNPEVVGDGDLMNTGYIPFQQGPVYINYAAPDRIGSTDFAIW